MELNTIAILMPGDMGHAVGRAFREHGYNVITCLKGRGEKTHTRMVRAGLKDVGTMAALVDDADLILSILPPASALGQARLAAQAMKVQDKRPIYVDCNAISPETAIAVGRVISEAGATFIDSGIIGPPPGRGSVPRFYVSGPECAVMSVLDGKGIQVIGMGPKIGKASAIKMTYAGLTKGTWTLHTAVLLASEQLGVTEALLSEFENSQKAALTAMRASVPYLPADSARWVGEMEEVAKTFDDAGVTPQFHKGAMDIFGVLEKTPLAAETRDDMDRARTLEQALAVYKKQLSSDS
jgi:putative dehydrogenase